MGDDIKERLLRPEGDVTGARRSAESDIDREHGR